MEAHQERVITEQKELYEKILKLDAFIEGTLFESVNDHEQVLLKDQLDAMQKYSDILFKRIRNF